jgi:glycosyltransferase involved in cell wall biosynthesis
MGKNRFSDCLQGQPDELKPHAGKNRAMKVVLVYRPKRRGGYSIEELFRAVAGEIKRDVQVVEYETHGLWNLLSDVYVLRTMQGDIYHVTGDIHYMAVLLPWARTILTIHDLGHFLHTLSGLKKWFYKWLWLILPIRSAAALTAISEKTRIEIERHLKVARPVTVVPNCYPAHFSHYPHRPMNAVPRLLQIGTSVHKNIYRIIEAVKGLDCCLVIIGVLNERIRQKIVEAGINFESYCDLTPQQLLNEYILADLVCFVSLYEGFGLPILEAQIVGRPVMTSRNPPMCDVASDSACLVDPCDVQAIRDGIKRILNDDDYRTLLVEKGYRNAARYAPAVVAQQYTTVYRDVAAQASAAPQSPIRILCNRN